jgi:hypothetical protein
MRAMRRRWPCTSARLISPGAVVVSQGRYALADGHRAERAHLAHDRALGLDPDQKAAVRSQ